MASDLAAACLAAFVAITLAIALLRDDMRFAGAPKWFWMEKLDWGPSSDVVVAGDSRTYRGIDPSIFASTHPRGCVNFGFSSVTLSPEFLSAAVAALAPGGDRILAIGLTPASLRAPLANRDGFAAARIEYGRLRMPLRLARAVEEWELMVAPFAIDRGFGDSVQAARATAAEYAQEFHPDGWVESDRAVDDPVGAGLAVVRRDFERSTHSPQVLDEMVSAVRELSEGGTRVFVFRPWVPDPVASEEDRIGGVDWSAARSRLEAVGARWLDISVPGLRSYDGTHLDGPSARRFSEELRRSIDRATVNSAVHRGS
jgi:hypothetical protein